MTTIELLTCNFIKRIHNLRRILIYAHIFVLMLYQLMSVIKSTRYIIFLHLLFFCLYSFPKMCIYPRNVKIHWCKHNKSKFFYFKAIDYSVHYKAIPDGESHEFMKIFLQSRINCTIYKNNICFKDFIFVLKLIVSLFYSNSISVIYTKVEISLPSKLERKINM